MSKRDEQRSRLLAETFHAEWDDGPTAAFARAAAAHARRRRQARRTLSAAGGAICLGAVLFFVARREPTPAFHPAPITPVAKAATRGYEVISDDEFLAEIRDRPVLIVKKENGGREIILLQGGSE